MKTDKRLVAKLNQLEVGAGLMGANGHGIHKTGANSYTMTTMGGSKTGGALLGKDGHGQRKGGSVSGGSAKQKAKAKSNPWIQHVKAYAKKHGIKYGDAISKARASYKK